MGAGAWWGRKVARLPDEGVAIVATDLQGNLEDFRALARIHRREREAGRRAILVLCGDLVHGPATSWCPSCGPITSARSIAIAPTSWCSSTWAWSRDNETVCLLGNHEHAHVGGPVVSKFHLDEAAVLEERLGDRTVEQVRAFISEFPLIAVAPCGLVCTHGAPRASEADLDAFERLRYEGFRRTPLWRDDRGRHGGLALVGPRRQPAAGPAPARVDTDGRSPQRVRRLRPRHRARGLREDRRRADLRVDLVRAVRRRQGLPADRSRAHATTTCTTCGRGTRSCRCTPMSSACRRCGCPAGWHERRRARARRGRGRTDRASLLERSPEFGDRYFTAAERAACLAARRPAARWAACFAVKEALLKALGTGVLGSIPLVRHRGRARRAWGAELTLRGAAGRSRSRIGVRWRAPSSAGRQGLGDRRARGRVTDLAAARGARPFQRGALVPQAGAHDLRPRRHPSLRLAPPRRRYRPAGARGRGRGRAGVRAQQCGRAVGREHQRDRDGHGVRRGCVGRPALRDGRSGHSVLGVLHSSSTWRAATTTRPRCTRFSPRTRPRSRTGSTPAVRCSSTPRPTRAVTWTGASAASRCSTTGARARGTPPTISTRSGAVRTCRCRPASPAATTRTRACRGRAWWR